MKSGNLKFLEPSEPLQACNMTDLPLTAACVAYIWKVWWSVKFENVYK
jgi:hypothetical protein